MAAADAVVLGTIGLNTGEAALRTGATRMEPFPVGVEHVLDIIFAGTGPVLGSERTADMVPCFALYPDEIKVTVEPAMAEVGVGDFVE